MGAEFGMSDGAGDGQGPGPADRPDQLADLRRRLRRVESRATAFKAGGSPARPRGPAPVVQDDRSQSLQALTAGTEHALADGSKLWLIEQPAADHRETGPRLNTAFAAAVGKAGHPIRCRLAELYDCMTADPAPLLFVDLETAGLSSSPVFLIGAMVWQGGGLVVRQYFARNYAEERAILAGYAELAVQRPVLVSFNGKSFDWPFLKARAAVAGLTLPEPAAHLDLLHESRRRWGATLPNCKLQTLETRICGRRRFGDIPGQAIPDAYHRYVHSGRATEMAEVLKHNLLDLLTLADLMARFAEDGLGR